MSRSTISTFQLFAMFPDVERDFAALHDRIGAHGKMAPF